MREDPRLAQINALCDTAEREAQEWLAAHPEDEGVLRPYVDVADVRAVLGAAPAQPSTSGAVWVPEPLPPLLHDWRWGEIDGGNEPGRRVAVSVCWACDAVAWNEPDFLALDPRPCPGHPEVALVREAFAAHPEWFASGSARRRIAELLRVPT